mgnify:CR=1 FL=1
MASEIANAKNGLGTLIGNISAVKQVFDYPPEDIHEMPAMVLLFEGRDTEQTLGGSTFLGTIRGTLLISTASTKQAFDELDAYMEPLGTNSIEAAIDADTTWGSTVDTGRLQSIENVGYREVGGGRYAAADFVFGFLKQVTT